MRVHVEEQRLAAADRLHAGGDGIEILNLTVGVANAEVRDILPGDVSTPSGSEMRAQFVQRRQCAVGQTLAVGVECTLVGECGAEIGLLDRVAVEQIGAGTVGARVGIENPLAQQCSDLVIGAVALALVDVGRGVVARISSAAENAHPLHCHAELPVRCLRLRVIHVEVRARRG